MGMGTQPPAAQEAPQGQPQQASGKASELVANVHDGMVQLLDMMNQSPAFDQQERQQLASILQNYRGFVEGVLVGEGQQAPQKPVEGTTTPEAGNANVLPA